jgi:outer membrane lipoprotein-sorting protein
MKHTAVFVFILTLSPFFNLEAQEIFYKYARLKDLSANFSYRKVIKSIGVTISSKGDLKFTRPDSFEWNITSPNKISMIYKNNAVSIIEDGKLMLATENAKLDQKMLSGIKHIKAFMMLDLPFIKDNYSILELAEKKIELNPINKSFLFKKIIIKMGKENPVEELSLIELNDDQIYIEFYEAKTKYEK